MLRAAILGLGIAMLPVGSTGNTRAAVCEGFGPQTPRDIEQKAGLNPRVFSFAPRPSVMNLCNIHFHRHAEHKAADFSLPGGEGEFGGFRCNATSGLTAAELEAPDENACSNVAPGDTVEVHWVYSSCDVAPGAGLGSCLSDACANPDLRVETQVFLVVNDPDAADFRDYDYAGVVGGYHQPKAVPSDTGDPVTFTGSTTGPSYSESKCSPLQVSWSVRPQCAKVDIGSLSKWCEQNSFAERGAHGVRPLVVAPALLSPID